MYSSSSENMDNYKVAASDERRGNKGLNCNIQVQSADWIAFPWS